MLANLRPGVSLASYPPCGYNLPAMLKNIETRYQNALDYLYSYVDFSLTHQQNLSPENFDLTRMYALMEALGQPQQAYPSLHVAGSKGKGSVCAFCAAALQAQGYRVGLYTSPHLRDFEERIQVNGQPIARADLVEIIDEIMPYVDAIPRLTTFEISTALAFWYFARQKVDVAVIEVGLGGRLDATNIITPQVSVITALYLEHTYVLGNTIEEIAAEKGGIIKPGVPVILAPQQDSALEVINRMAVEKDAALVYIPEAYPNRPETYSLTGQSFTISPPNQPPVKLAIPLLGPHQIENAVVAYAALDSLRGQAIPIEDAAIQQGFANIYWPGRFEVLRQEPPVIVDSAHTPGAMVRLQETLDLFFPQRPVYLMVGVSEDKDIPGMLAALKPRTERIYCAQAPHPRAMKPEALAEAARFLGKPVSAFSSPASALEMAVREAPPEAVVLVTGSIFIAASARIAWFERAHTE